MSQFSIRWLLVFTLTWLMSSATFAAEMLAGSAFREALERKSGRAWTGVTLREAIKGLSEQTRIAILLDRRIDPTLELNLSVPLVPLRSLVNELAGSVNAKAVVVGNVVYLGSEDATAKLPTLIELRRDELRKLAAEATATKSKSAKSPWSGRTASLLQQKSFAWEDLDRPREVLKQIAARNQLELIGLDSLPHDLWASSALPQVTTVEALSVILIQFNSTFEFLPDRLALRIIPIPDKIEIIKRPAGDSKSLKPEASKTGKASAKLSERTFKDVAFGNTPLQDVIRALEGSGIKFDYDKVAIRMAEISLEQKVEFSAKQVTAEKMIRDIFEPLGFDVSIVGEVVILRPKPKAE